MATAVETKITAREYLEIELAAESRSQFIDGVMYPMPGARVAHIKISGNLVRAIGTQLLGRPGFVFNNDMRVAVDLEEFHTYPDVGVVAGEPLLLENTFDTLLNPAVLIEILSPSTEADDRGPKFERYKRLESLREYVLVAQDRVDVERYSRRGEEWVSTRLESLAASLRLESIGVDVPLREVYDKTPAGES